ncbi:AmpG family muropeptide MFS transporter [Candidatus Jidaibacter acanthamoebae]|uniref:AmpG family muropeptide MFS transporter n=1 Tax=Candidatus Jidaibacter acanthamoebae TaxID=86105 RepID=UPI0006A726AA|nr:MFS transporter [Candidatus Jidaibacter acanthamoeba]
MFSKFAPKKKMFLIFILGFSCGLPLPLTLSTLSAYLYEYGFSLSSIGLFGLSQLPYSLKPFWSPLLDNLNPPFLSFLGKRRGWLIIIQVFLFIFILLLGQFNPKENIYLLAMITLGMAFFSASQDIIVDALRVESLEDDEQGMGVAYYTFGYRAAMFIATAGALYLADIFSWSYAFFVLSILSAFGIISALLMDEPKHQIRVNNNASGWFYNSFIVPFLDFTNHRNWYLILLFVALYKLSDAYLGAMTSPFLLEQKFSKMEIAEIVKFYGVFATLLGTFAGGYLVKYINIYVALFWGGIISSVSNLAFILLCGTEHDIPRLIVVITIENFASGLSSATFVAYMGTLCNRQFTASQFALLSSLASVGRTTLSSTSGFLAQQIGWVDFFIFSAILCLPALILLKFINNSKKDSTWNSNTKLTETQENQI